MSQSPQFSVVIVSRHRPDDLAKVLAALKFQTLIDFEVIVVAPEQDFNTLAVSYPSVKFVAFDEANISKGRNLGINQAAAPLIAFCDDDGVPEIYWLDRLRLAFNCPDVASAGGPVRGRNGINFQWTSRFVNENAQEWPVDLDNAQDVHIINFDRNGFLKLQGTNIAFRTTALRKIGGFDENFQFYLDETDVLLRLGLEGWASAYVPLAEVQHGFQKSARRTPARAPKSLTQEGRSTAYFLRKHSFKIGETLDSVRRIQNRRVLEALKNGNLGPWDVSDLKNSLEQGISEGLHLGISNQTPLMASEIKPKLFTKQPNQRPIAIFGNALRWRMLKAKSLELTSQGHPITVFRMTYTALFHRRYFSKLGFWVQAGGWFGRSIRARGLLRLKSRKNRMAAEVIDHTNQRPFEKVFYISLSGKTKVIDN